MLLSEWRKTAPNPRVHEQQGPRCAQAGSRGPRGRRRSRLLGDLGRGSRLPLFDHGADAGRIGHDRRTTERRRRGPASHGQAGALGKACRSASSASRPPAAFASWRSRSRVRSSREWTKRPARSASSFVGCWPASTAASGTPAGPIVLSAMPQVAALPKVGPAGKAAARVSGAKDLARSPRLHRWSRTRFHSPPLGLCPRPA